MIYGSENDLFHDLKMGTPTPQEEGEATVRALKLVTEDPIDQEFKMLAQKVDMSELDEQSALDPFKTIGELEGYRLGI